MVDYAQADLLVRLADNPEIDPTQDKILFGMTTTRMGVAGPLGSYAREDDRTILTATDIIPIDFDAFENDKWIEVAFKNEGANPVNITLSDQALDFTIVLPAGQCMLLRHYKGQQAAPQMVSALGTIVRMFAWGPPYQTPQ